MRFRTTLILLLIAVGLGGYLYFVEVPKATEQARKKTLLEFKADDATAVTLAYPDRTIELQKSGDAWRIAKPLDTAADQTAARNLVNAIATCEVKKDLTNPEKDLATYGLDKPAVTIHVRLKDKELPAIEVGKNTPVGFSTYVSLGSDKTIRLVSSAFASGMDKKVKDLRDKTILAFNNDDVHQIAVRGDGKNLLLTHQGDAWRVEQPFAAPADDATVRTFLSSMRAMRAVDFPSDKPEELPTYGLDSPRLTITLHMAKGNEEKTLLVGGNTEKKDVYVKLASAPTVYTISEWVYRDLNKDAKDFRDKTVLHFEPAAVQGLEIKRADGSTTTLAQGADHKWQIKGQPTARTLPGVITQYIRDVNDLKGYDIAAEHPANLADFGLASPLLSITLSGAKDAKIGTVLLGRHDTEAKKTEYTAMAAGGDTVFLLRDYLFTRLDKPATAFVQQPTPSTTRSPVIHTADPDEDGDD